MSKSGWYRTKAEAEKALKRKEKQNPTMKFGLHETYQPKGWTVEIRGWK